MLKFFRKKENIKRMMWALAILIIPAFVLWGAGSSVRSGRLPKYAGKIFGKNISFKQYEASLRACRNQAIMVYGESINQIAQLLDLEQEAWERLILLYLAQKEKIRVSNQELISVIQNMPLFQKDGRFSQDRYNLFSSYTLRTNPREFEEQIRELLKIEKHKIILTNHINLTEEEIEEAYKYENEQAQALYVFVDPQDFSEEVHPAYEELQDYYQIHKDDFKKPEQANVQYLALYFDQARSKVNVSEEEIQNYYQEHPEQFSIEGKEGEESIQPLKEVKAQIEEELIQEKVQILLEDQIWEIAEEIAAIPQTLEQAAQENQLEIKETGFFGPQEVIPEIGLSYEFLTAAFSLEIGEISNPIHAPKGYFIIKVNDKKDAYIPALEEIKEELESAVILQKSRQLAENKGEELLVQIKELISKNKLSFSKAAEKLSLAVLETDEFTRSSYISGIGQSQEFAQAAFALEPEEISNLISVPNGYCILSLKKIIPFEEEKFAQEKEEFAQRLLIRKKEGFYKNWRANLKRAANLVDNIAKFKAQQNP